MFWLFFPLSESTTARWKCFKTRLRKKLHFSMFNMLAGSKQNQNQTKVMQKILRDRKVTLRGEHRKFIQFLKSFDRTPFKCCQFCDSRCYVWPVSRIWTFLNLASDVRRLSMQLHSATFTGATKTRKSKQSKSKLQVKNDTGKSGSYLPNMQGVGRLGRCDSRWKWHQTYSRRYISTRWV